jgi:hypothetical protein
MVIDEEWSCDDFEDEKIMTEIKALLISYGAKQARDLYADIPERYILISTNYPTGMLTYKKNIKPENIININENLINEFKSWILQEPKDWKLPKEIYKEYYERGFEIAEKIKKIVGPNIEIKINYLTCEVWEENQYGKYEWKTIL